MPRIELKQIQKELEKGLLWPVYWLYGLEEMKAQELVKRIRKTVTGGGAPTLMGLNEEIFYASEVSAETLLDAAQSLSLGGGVRFILVREAHLLKDPECLSVLMGAPVELKDASFVCVFVSKDLDQRKKFSKVLVEKAAVVACEEVKDHEREAWIQYFAKLKNTDISAALMARLQSLDPWNLNIVDHELEKLLLFSPAFTDQEARVLLVPEGHEASGEEFLEFFFQRNLKGALEKVGHFASKPEESIPLLGLMAWNLRYLVLKLSSGDGLKLNPYVVDKLRRWAPNWPLQDALKLQTKLFELDFGTKQTPRLPLGLWGNLVLEFCR